MVFLHWVEQQGYVDDYGPGPTIGCSFVQKNWSFQKGINSDRIGISGYKKNRYPAARNL
jgi:hypothetical protein